MGSVPRDWEAVHQSHTSEATERQKHDINLLAFNATFKEFSQGLNLRFQTLVLLLIVLLVHIRERTNTHTFMFKQTDLVVHYPKTAPFAKKKDAPLFECHLKNVKSFITYYYYFSSKNHTINEMFLMIYLKNYGNSGCQA